MYSNAIEYIMKGSKGSKGGGSQSQTLTPDNLRSKDTVEVILGLCEGPIFGLKNGAKSFKVGDTFLQNQNDDYNFKAFQLKVFTGTDDPDPVIPVLGGSSSNNAVNLSLEIGLPVVRQTQSGGIDFIDVRLAFGRLFRSDTKGTWGLTGIMRLEFKPLSESTWTKVYGSDIKLTGKTTSTYVKEIRIAVPRIDEPYEVRVTKISPTNDVNTFFDVSWESFQETIAGNPVYPNTAILHLVAEASDQFSSIPAWSGVYKTKIVRVPTNYDPESRIYTGVWDGTFKLAYTNNPAWCLYDFVMNARFGIAYYYPEVNLDRYDVYEAAQWCDELVPNGRGGLQPRYTMNISIAEARSGRELAKYMAGAFNSTFFDDLDGRAFLRVDKDEDACHIFTRENTYEDAGFDYSYTDITSRYNDITVVFKNAELNNVEDRRRIYDQALIDKNGPITLDFIAVGTTDFHEATRRAQYKLITANTETCIVNFKTNRRGQMVNPFDIMLISDPDMGYGISGRVKTVDASAKKITLRDPVYLEAGVPYEITFELADGSFLRTELHDTIKGYNYELNFHAELPLDNLPEKTVFTLEHATLLGLPRPFRVTKVEEEDGNPDVFVIEGINVNRNKWYDADNVTSSGVIDYSVLPDPFDPPGPSDVTFGEEFVRGDRAFHLTVSPTFDRTAYKYYSNDHSFEVWSRPKGGTEPYVRQELKYGDTIIDHKPGLTEFKVLGKSYLGGRTLLETAPTYTYNVANPKDPPADIDWVRISDKEVYWGYASPPDDFAGFQVRYHNQVDRDTWDDAVVAHQGLLSATSFYTSLIPPSARVIMVRAVDLFGIPSVNSAIIVRPLGDLKLQNIVEQFDYAPVFAGTKVGASVVGDELKADDTGGLVYSGVPTSFVYDGGDMYEATYNELQYYDTFEILAPGYLIIDIDFEGSGYEVKIRDDDPDAIWISVPERMYLDTGSYQLALSIFGGKVRGSVSKFTAIVDVDDIEESFEDVNIGLTGLYHVPLTKNFTVIKKVSVIIQSSGSPDEAFTSRIIDKNHLDGPLFEVLTKDGDRTSGTVDIEVKGY